MTIVLFLIVIFLLALVIFYLHRLNNSIEEINFFFVDKLGFGRDKLKNLEYLSHLEDLGYINENVKNVCQKITKNSKDIFKD